MVQGGGGAGLALEAVERLTVLQQVFGEKLQRNLSAELGVLGSVNNPHPAAA